MSAPDLTLVNGVSPEVGPEVAVPVRRRRIDWSTAGAAAYRILAAVGQGCILAGPYAVSPDMFRSDPPSRPEGDAGGW